MMDRWDVLYVSSIFMLGMFVGSGVPDSYNPYISTSGGSGQLTPSSTGNVSIGTRYNHIQANRVDVDWERTYSGASLQGVECGYVTGMSMQPTIHHGNTICWEDYRGYRTIKPGMIVRYPSGDGYTVHRVKGVYPSSGEVYIQGDNNRYGEVITYGNITDVVVATLYTKSGEYIWE